MIEDNLIQQSLFGDETRTVTTQSDISDCENLTNEVLANNGKSRPRLRKILMMVIVTKVLSQI